MTHIDVRSFRSLQSVMIPLHDYTSFVGPNGAGKSSFLYALDWFFGNRDMSPEDVTVDSTCNEISVSVTFGHLSERDRDKLGAFAADERATFKKSYSLESGRSSYTGLARQGPGFEEVLAGTKVGEFRPAYKQLREKVAGLPDLGATFSLDQVREAFQIWVGDSANAESVVMQEQPADALFSTPGTLGDLCQFVLIKGSLDLANETHTAAKNSLLSVLTSGLIEGSRSHTIDSWKTTNAEVISALRTSTRDAVHSAIKSKTQLINNGLSRYDNRSEVILEATDPEVELWTAPICPNHGQSQPLSLVT